MTHLLSDTPIYKGDLYHVYWLEIGGSQKAKQAFAEMRGKGKAQIFEAITFFADRGLMYQGRGHAQNGLWKFSENVTLHRIYGSVDEEETPMRLILLSHFISDHKQHQESREGKRAALVLKEYLESKNHLENGGE
jgi:hypothetical protein